MVEDFDEAALNALVAAATKRLEESNKSKSSNHEQW